jgi:Bacterial pre-peptidase C-terminal domain
MRKILFLLAFAACEAPQADDLEFQKNDDWGKADSSNQATVLTFEFDAELLTDSSWNTNQTIQDQLLYTIGHLNGSRAVGRLDKLTLTNVRTSTESGKTKIAYHAKMPVAWGAKTNLPTSYAFKLPRDVSGSALETFTTKHKEACVDFGAHDVNSGSMWYYYRPNNSGCSITDAELVKFTATVSVSPTNTTGKYPEYHKVWEDGALRIVAIFGKYEEGGQAGDAGVDAFNTFVSRVKSTLGVYSLTTVPATLPAAPGPSLQDVQFTATLADGKQVIVNALLVDIITNPGAWFSPRYTSLTPKADVIAYNGHAGLGQNVRALARMGTWSAGQYLMMFMNGCDTFAYVDGYMAQTRAAINHDDPTGTKYMDIVTNGMPAFFASDAGASMAILNGLLAYANPKTYEEMFRNIDNSQVVLVSGEEDNVYFPGFGGGGNGGGMNGMLVDADGEASQGEDLAFETGTLAAGRYTVTLSGASGDADLYVKVGSAPTHSSYDCRPYQGGSNESCDVTLSASAKIYILVNGYDSGSNPFHVKVTGAAAPPAGVDLTAFNYNDTVAKNVEKRYQTATLPAGRYTFTMTGTGDADLYVRTGAPPSTTSYECRPYTSGSSETCNLTLNAAGPIHVMVRGYAASSAYHLTAKQAN